MHKHSIKQQLLLAAQELASCDTARLDAEVLLSHVLNKPRSYLFSWPEKKLCETQLADFYALLKKRKLGEPIAYLLGSQEFWSLQFKVTPATLIPRPETEQLVDAVLAHFPQEKITLWDAGTGTGAIAIALASERSAWHIYASDISADALAVASENIHANNVNVTLCQVSWLDAVADNSLDVLVSNPPYIRDNDKHLAALTYEPISALVADENGLGDIVTLIKQGLRVLKNGARIYIEHGYDQGESVPQLLVGAGYTDVICIKDYAALPRFTTALKAG